ncbi:MAG: hypothetical protein V2A79_18080 [Planctomycetota bacterium]
MKYDRRGWGLACVVVGLLAASVLASGEKSQAPTAQEEAQAVTPKSAEKTEKKPTETTLQLRFEVLELRFSPEEVARVNGAGQATDIAALAGGVIERGDARVKYSLGGPVTLDHKAVMSAGYRLPFVRSKRASDTGQKTTVLEHENIGCELTLLPRAPQETQEKAVVALFQVELRELLQETTVETPEGETSPILSSLKQEFTARIPLARDAYFWSLMRCEQVRDRAGTLLYVYRVRFDSAG